ncbi:bifunctional diguanylate cyclase/phosphodiesterase [Marinimicrobium sp. ABcell2]|uniref:putative bifunctional diguanylate cyclase/phosphodiesterase n=1 Tax=Marinimicrobium sp. ABcell2 TaxID=3069751 RepID=UPI0027B5E03E|nr:GGDEF domain-containing response regulator [Marinimicrobium sp. ABcell2]MDQ2078384.1 EAL domain-containing protein [Marinimicrobium sp. ABcell2]
MDRIVKVLFIDSEEGEYLLIADLLSQIHHTDYQLVWHPRLEGALQAILADDYDLVLLDYYWGDENARELLKAAKTQACQAPIVVMTDEMETEVDRDAIRGGASDYLIKGQIDNLLLERTLRYSIERKRTEQHLSRLAHYDTLTDIPNRILFRDRLEHAIRLADRDNTSFTLMFIDLNGFKQVNDSFGHDIGDEVIRMCADRLKECMRRSDSVARMGGDEFTLLLENTDSSTDVAHVAEKIIARVGDVYQVGGYELTIGCSVGIAVYPQAGRDAEVLLKNADMAMYQAKQREESSFRFFTEAMNQQVHRQLRLESDLRTALNHDQLTLVYQPRIDIHSGTVIAVEALLRWRHPERGLLDASEFIGVAEDTGLITAMGYWAIAQACEDLVKIRQACRMDLLMSVNMSVRQFNDDQLVQNTARIFANTGVRGDDIEFELSETSFMENVDLVSLCMRPLSYLGVTFALDNFGTGSSSFLHLQRLPISSVKIDSQFMTELASKRSDRRLVSAMITLAHNLGKTVVAEGVETKQQKDWLTESGCDHMQGYYLCAPLPFDSLCTKLKNGSLLTPETHPTPANATVPADPESGN